MKFIFFLMLIVGISNAHATDLEGFGVIREFAGNDKAAMFGLLPQSGTLQITGVSGPSFLGSVRVGELNQVAIDHLFLKSAKPMGQREKRDLIAKYSSAQVIYFEGYSGELCSPDEVEYHIGVAGNVDGAPFNATFEFIALPNSSGDCAYHKFITSTHG